MAKKEVPAMRQICNTTQSGGLHRMMLTSALVTGLVSFSCVKEPLSPVMPTWDVNLTLPLLNRAYSIAQIVEKDTSLLGMGTGNVLSFITSSDLRPAYTGSSVSFTPRIAGTNMKLGVFNVSMPPIISPIMIPGLPAGAQVPIPDTTFAAPVVRDTISTFESVSLAEGTMTLTFRNNLPVPVDVVAPVYMTDDANNVIAVFEYNPATIPANSSRAAQDDLASKTIGSPQVVGNVVSITGLMLHIHGSSAPVRIPYGEMMVATIATSGLKAHSATNVLLPSQRLIDTDSSRLPFSDSTMIQEVLIKSGGLTMTMQSGVDLDMTFRFRFKELFRPLGGSFVPYEDSVFLPRLGSATRVLNPAGYRIRSSGGTLLSFLEAVSTVIIPISAIQPVSLHDTDKVSVTLAPTAPIVVDSFIGVVRPTWMNFNAVVPLGLKNLPSKLRAELHIPSASLVLSTESSVGFPLDAFLQVGSQRGNGDSVVLQVPASQRRLHPGTGTIRFDATAVGQFLSRLSDAFPDSIRISGRALVNPPDAYVPSLAGVGRIGSNCSLSGRMDLQIPLNLGIMNGTYTDTVALGDTSGTGLRQFTPDKNRLSTVSSGKIHVDIRNGTALQVDIALGLLDGSKHRLLSLPGSGQTIHVNAATVDGEGNVTEVASSRVVLDLTAADVRQFNPAEFVTYSLSFVTTPGVPVVRIKPSDGVRLRIWSVLSYTVQ